MTSIFRESPRARRGASATVPQHHKRARIAALHDLLRDDRPIGESLSRLFLQTTGRACLFSTHFTRFYERVHTLCRENMSASAKSLPPFAPSVDDASSCWRRESDSLFPAPLPYPEMHTCNIPTGGRRRQRYMRKRRIRRWTNLVVILFSWLALGSPKDLSLAGLCVGRPTALQKAFAERADSLVQDFASRQSSGWRGGRAALQQQLLRLQVQPYHEKILEPPKFLSAANASLPAHAAAVALDGRFARPLLADLYREEHPFDLPEEQVPLQAPNACSCIVPGQTIPLLALAWDCGLLGLVPVGHVPRVGGIVAAAELFGVAKKLTDKLRLIVDRRRRNSMEMSLRTALMRYVADVCPERTDEMNQLLRHFVLPHASQFSDIVMDTGERLFVDMDDVADFFYMLLWPPVRDRENAVCSEVRPSQLLRLATDRVDLLEALVARGDEPLQPVFRAPAMGDQKASEVAGGFHHGLLIDHGALPADCWMSYGHPPPGGDIWKGVYSDDIAQIGIGADTDDALRSRRSDLCDATVAAHQAAGTVLHEGKRVRDAKHHIVWGGELDSDKQRASGEVDTMVQLIRVTLAACLSEHLDAHSLSAIVSTWVHMTSFAKCSLVLFDKLFQTVDQNRKTGKRRIGIEERDELLAVVLLAPFLHADLGAELATEAFCTDATTTMGAIVRTDITALESVFLWSRLPRRGGPTRLWTEDAVDLSHDALRWNEELTPEDHLLGQWIDETQWQHVVAWKMGKEAHINLQEGNAIAALVRRTGKRRVNWRKRCFLLVDSQVNRGAWTRGRSSSSKINRIMRKTLGYTLGVGIRWHLGYVRTHLNPADDGTRFKRLRPAKAASMLIQKALALAGSLFPRPLRVTRRQRRRAQRAADSGIDDAPSESFVAHRKTIATELGGAPLITADVPVTSGGAKSVGPSVSQRLLVDICAGANRPLSCAAERRRGWTATSFDIETDPIGQDILRLAVLDGICSLLKERRDRGLSHLTVVSLGPTCRTFSAWMQVYKFSSRSTSRPMGRGRGRPLNRDELLGNRLLAACLAIAACADECGIEWTWEQPVGSLMWKTRGWKKLYREGAQDCAIVDWCRFGRTWRKTTAFRGRGVWLAKLHARCEGGHIHEVLQGSVVCPDGVRRNRTANAAEYDACFCDMYLKLVDDDMDRRVATCTTASTLADGRRVRFGDASHPGPLQRPLGPSSETQFGLRWSPTCVTGTSFQS
jgi:hypothetical protein